MDLESYKGRRIEELIPDDISEIASEPKICQKGHHQKKSHLLGGIHINYPLYFFIPLLIFSCLYCYHKAVSQKQQKPFPHATITNTACHYPQDIVFRYLMLPAGSFITLVYYVAFQWLKAEKKRIQFPFSIQSWLQPLSMISVIGFYCAIGTIDSAGYPNIHTYGAVTFFIVLYLTAGAVTLVSRQMHNWDPTVLSRTSLITKTLCVAYITGVAIYCAIGGIMEALPTNDDDIYVVIIEWNLTLGGLVWLLTFTFDWKNMFLTLKGDFSQTVAYIRR